VTIVQQELDMMHNIPTTSTKETLLEPMIFSQMETVINDIIIKDSDAIMQTNNDDTTRGGAVIQQKTVIQ
jgi:hypothetical protein